MKRLVCFCLVLTGFSALATDWYADADHGNDLWDGTSPDFVSGTTGPKKTLQAALDIEGLKSGDTLWLLPGDYNDGAADSCRGFITVSGLKIKSTGGADVTFVTGASGTRCFGIDESATGVILDGLTLRNGAAGAGNGGGVNCPGGDCWVIGCVISNCTATIGGAMCGGNAYRTKMLDCTASSRGGCVSACGWLYNCLLTGSNKTPVHNGAKLVNTTICGCITTSTLVFHEGEYWVSNCIIVHNGSNGNGNGCSSSVAKPLHVANTVFGQGNLQGVTDDELMTCRTDVSLVDSKVVCFAARDFRVLTSSPAAELGDAAHLADVTLPAGYEHLDLAGRPMPTSGAIAAGCYQCPAKQLASRIDFFGAVTVKGYGCSFKVGDYLYPTAAAYAPGDYPVLRLKPVNEKAYAIYSNEILMSNNKAHRHHAESDGWTDFVPLLPTDANTTVYVEAVASAKFLYVDPAGNDEWDGLSPTNVPNTLTGPVRSPMVAVTNATECSTIFLAPGTYDYCGFVTRTDGSSNVARFRIDTLGKQLAFVGTEGAEKTILVGAFDTDDPSTYGRGPKAVGGIYASGTYVFVKGLTITGCGTQNFATPTSTPALQRGAALNGIYSYTLVSDCIITNNTACMASSVNNSQVFRCVIAENDAYMDVVRDANCYGCVCYGNVIRYGNGKNNNNSFCDGGGSLNFCSIDFRSALHPNGRYQALSSSSTAKYGAFVGYIGEETFTDTVAHEDPLFAGPAKGDFRLGVLSPAIGRAQWESLTPFERIAIARDILGNRVTVDENGAVPAGAVNNAPFLPCVAVDVKGADIPFARDSLVRGTNVVTAASATLSVETPTKRPFAGFEVNGVLEETASLTLTDFTPGESRAVTVLSGTNWYVDATGGNDLNGGGSPGLAKRTIRCATTNAVAHDVISVMPGTYCEAEGVQDAPSSGLLVKSRVLVPPDVTLVSTEGAEKTIIVGAASPTPEDSFGLGLGSDAVRCVWARARSVVRGFTLTGGRAMLASSGGNNDTVAGGIFGWSTPDGAIAEDCIISNNCAKNGAGAMYVNLRRCRIVENRVVDTGYGPAVHTCPLTGCFVDRNYGNDTAIYPTRIESTTFGPNNYNTYGSAVRFIVGYGGTVSIPVLNSVFCRGYLGDGQCYIYATNSVFNAEFFGDASTYSRVFATNCCNCVVTNLDAIGVAADGRLLATSPAVDLGDAEIASAAANVNGTDAYGTQRIYNGALDAGAAEFDWRPDYGRALNRRVSVEVASPEVTLADRTLVLPSGELAGTVDEAGSYSTTVAVTGKGTLDLYVADALRGSFTKDDGPKTVSLKDVAAGDSFRFAYTPGDADDGAGLVTSWKLDRGLVLIFR